MGDELNPESEEEPNASGLLGGMINGLIPEELFKRDFMRGP